MRDVNALRELGETDESLKWKIDELKSTERAGRDTMSDLLQSTN